MAEQPDLVLLGYGVDDSLQLTVESQRILSRVGKAYTVGLQPNVARFLKSLRVEVRDLSDHFVPGGSFSDCYLDIADYLLRRVAEEQPVIFLTPGNPLFLNSLSRFLALQARQHELRVQVLPGVSIFDTIVCDIGLDVGTFGVQLLDAQRMVTRRQQINADIPLIVLQMGGFGLEAVADAEERNVSPAAFDELVAHLGKYYPQDHLVTLLNREPGQGAAAKTVPLSRFRDLVQHFAPSSSLFIDRLREQKQRSAPIVTTEPQEAGHA
jgi:precorrin-2 methylase